MSSSLRLCPAPWAFAQAARGLTTPLGAPRPSTASRRMLPSWERAESRRTLLPGRPRQGHLQGPEAQRPVEDVGA
eukprot:14958681-Alexandrium_andersonii.AAC.1